MNILAAIVSSLVHSLTVAPASRAVPAAKVHVQKIQFHTFTVPALEMEGAT